MSGLRNGLLLVIAVVQVIAALRVALRLMRTAGGTRIQRSADPEPGERVTVVVPVLDERDRLLPCLEGLMAQPDEVQEILVVDGGSRDGTQELVHTAAERDVRIRLLDATPIPRDWNGKAHGLQTGLLAAAPDSNWVLTIDADVRPHADLVRSLLAHVSSGVALQGVATRQIVASAADALLHPALLTTLVYRHGIPGHIAFGVPEVQANGQCSLFRRGSLEQLGGFAPAHDSRCEDVTMARAFAEAGNGVGFHEADDLVEAAMYSDWRETWQNWPRSLTLRDRYAGVDGWLRLSEVTLVQGLPLAILGMLVFASPGTGNAMRSPLKLLRVVNLALLAMRLGILCGTRRAYKQPPVTYWLSPLVDLPVALRLWQSALQRTHTWRGRRLVPESVWSVS